MARDGLNPAVNAQPALVTDYGPNPRNPARGLLDDLVHRVQGFLVPAVVNPPGDPMTSFYGYGPQVQVFTGAAVGNSVVYRNDGNADISSGVVEGPEGDPARRIFAARLARRGGM